MPSISRYSQFYPWRDGYYLAYNARSGAVALMTGENYAAYQKLIEKLSQADNSLTADESTLLKQLEYGWFVHADTLDEYEHLKFQHRRTRFDESSLGLTIAPTMACNMACSYCYEVNKKGRMSAHTVEALIDFVEKRAPKLTRLDISWYGGEPLLALDIIGDISESVLDLATQFKLTYSASMISNGYLLTPEVVDKLVAWKVGMVQVTLDGPSRLHNQKRPLKNGKASFETIITNLQYASTKMNIGVRVNIDKSYSIDMVAELLAELETAGLKDRIGVHFGLIEPATSACSNIAETCYEVADFSAVEIDFYGLLLEQGFRIDKLPSPAPTFCMAQQCASLLIDADGDLYRCFNYVGDKSRACGNIRDPLDFTHPNFRRLFQFDPFEDEVCRACNILPVCMGGCPSRRADRELARDKICESWKYNLQPMLAIIARSRQQALQKAQQKAEAAKETV